MGSVLNVSLFGLICVTEEGRDQGRPEVHGAPGIVPALGTEQAAEATTESLHHLDLVEGREIDNWIGIPM
jgi:hypothetical protein